MHINLLCTYLQKLQSKNHLTIAATVTATAASIGCCNAACCSWVLICTIAMLKFAQPLQWLHVLNTRFIRSSQQAIAAAIAAIVPCIQRDTCEAVSKLYSRLPDIQLEYEISRRTIGGCLSGVPWWTVASWGMARRGVSVLYSDGWSQCSATWCDWCDVTNRRPALISGVLRCGKLQCKEGEVAV